MNRPHNVKAVLFDAGNTLLRVHPSVGEIYAGMARTYGVHADSAVIEAHFRRVFAESDGDLRDYTSEGAEHAWWRNLVESVFARAGLLSEFGPRFDAYFTELNALFTQGSVWRVFDDTVPALERLREMGYRCAVASNWDSRLPALLETMRLRSYFEFVLTSAEVGRAKPHPLLFERSLKQFELTPDDIVYVGDSFEHDVLGARQAGVKALLVDRHKHGHPRAETLHSLGELPAWLTSRTQAG